MKALKFVGWFVLGLVGVYFGMSLLATWPIPSLIAGWFATVMITGKTRIVFGKTVNMIWLAIVWSAGFLIMQGGLGVLFGVQLGSFFDKIEERSIWVFFYDPKYLGTAFFAQVAATVVSGAVAWWFASSPHRNRLLVPAVGVCIVYLLFSINPAWRLSLGSVIGKVEGRMHKTASAADLRRLFDDIEAESAPVMNITEDGVPLFEYSTATCDPKIGAVLKEVVEVPSVQKGSRWYFYLNRRMEHFDFHGTWYVPARRSWRDPATNTWMSQIGMFKADDVRPFMNRAIRELEGGDHRDSSPPVTAPAPSPAPAPVPTPTLPSPPPPPRNMTKRDMVTVAMSGDDWQPTKVVGYPGDTIVVTPKSGKEEDVARLRIRVGGAAPVVIEPVYRGGWVGVLNCAGLPNPLNQPVLFQLTDFGTPVGIVIEKM